MLPDRSEDKLFRRDRFFSGWDMAMVFFDADKSDWASPHHSTFARGMWLAGRCAISAPLLKHECSASQNFCKESRAGASYVAKP
jgi:hypothetical protein